MSSFWSKKIKPKVRLSTKSILFGAILFILITVLIIWLLPTDHTPSKNSIFLTNGNEVEVHFSIFIATIILAAIALIEFERSNKLDTNELLTFISNRWSSSEIIKARQIIHKIFVAKYRNDNECNPSKNFDKAVINSAIEILEASRKGGIEGEEFIFLLNLLDHFESVSYLHIKNELSFDDIKNIYGNNMIFYYRIFENYIKQRQSHNPDDFLNFTRMYNIFTIDKLESANK